MIALPLVALLASTLLLRALHGWQVGAVMLPDFTLYTQGGFGLFPSPLGRLLGSLGPDVFAAVSIVSAAATIPLVYLLASRRGSPPLLAALLAALSPATVYLGYAGIDPIGLALLLAGYASIAPLHRGLGVTLAALAHFSLAPFALAELARLGRVSRPAWLLLAGVTLPALLALLMTPYSGVLLAWYTPAGLLAGLVGLLVGLGLSLPALLLLRSTWPHRLAIVVGAAECCLQAHVQARYLLPAALLACAGSPRPWAPRAAGWCRNRLRALRTAPVALERPSRGGVVRTDLDACRMPRRPLNTEQPPLVTRAAPGSLDRMRPGRVLPRE